ncbi:MAG: chemotaxis protein CheW [Planctomycetota bacterium]|jgi:chemotaxis-related protein WspD
MTAQGPDPSGGPIDAGPHRDAANGEPRGDAADRLLGRPAPDWYLEAWSKSLQTPLASLLGEDEGKRVAAGIFRLGQETFAVETAYVREVRRPRGVHVVPGRTNEVFRGLVSIRGEIHLCVCLRTLLGLAAESEGAPADADGQRLILVERGGDGWAFEVDEVLDFRHFDERRVKDAQVTVAKSAVHFTRGLLEFGDGLAALLDPERLFGGFARSVS